MELELEYHLSVLLFPLLLLSDVLSGGLFLSQSNSFEFVGFDGEHLVEVIGLVLQVLYLLLLFSFVGLQHAAALPVPLQVNSLEFLFVLEINNTLGQLPVVYSLVIELLLQIFV